MMPSGIFLFYLVSVVGYNAQTSYPDLYGAVRCAIVFCVWFLDGDMTLSWRKIAVGILNFGSWLGIC